MRAFRALAVLVLCLGAAASACAPLGARSPAPAHRRPPSPVAVADAEHEYPSRPVTERAVESAHDPAAAVRAFAQAYVNWSASTVAADMRALAARSVGQARAAMQLAAAQTAQDDELRRGGVANHGRVEAVAPLPGRADRYVVVTLERTSATATDAYQGLAPAWHVAIATVSEPSPGHWVLSGWQPES